MISIARTGSGKTLGFILPGIMHILKQTPRAQGDGPIVVVLLPTRELAQQVEVVSREYCQAMGLKLTCCFGGAAKGPQQIALSRGGLGSCSDGVMSEQSPFRCGCGRRYSRPSAGLPREWLHEHASLQLPGVGRGRPHAGHGVRAADSQDHLPDSSRFHWWHDYIIPIMFSPAFSPTVRP